LRTEERDGSVAFLREDQGVKAECEVHGLIGKKVEISGSEDGQPVRSSSSRFTVLNLCRRP
jgi:hypothetical protein